MYQTLRLPKVNITFSQKYLAVLGIAAVGAILVALRYSRPSIFARRAIDSTYFRAIPRWAMPTGAC